jgi:Ca2+-binding EF-hand superfamily protein
MEPHLKGPTMLLPLLLAACWGAALLPAQAGGGGPNAGKGEERAVRGACTERQSRELFRACDADDDDRLDVFEAADALEAVRSPRDHQAFGRLDRDRDGFVSWPEFDAALRAVLQKGGTFRVRTARAVVEEPRAARAAGPVRQFLQLHDRNGDGVLDPGEVLDCVQKAALPAPLGATLRAADRNQDGRIDETELEAWFEQLPGRMLPQKALAGSPLPPPWHAADRNHDGAIDAAEFRAVLRGLDPALDAWADALLRALDKDKNGVLRAAELPREPSGPPTAPGPLPQQPPVR